MRRVIYSRRGPAALLLVALVTSCGEGAAGTEFIAASDSGDVIVVEYGGSPPAPIPACIGPNRGIEIGRGNDTAGHDLFSVRGVVLLADTLIAIANGNSEIRFYDAGARYLASVGRRGSGPGEFQRIAAIFPGRTGRWSSASRPDHHGS